MPNRLAETPPVRQCRVSLMQPPAAVIRQCGAGRPSSTIPLGTPHLFASPLEQTPVVRIRCAICRDAGSAWQTADPSEMRASGTTCAAGQAPSAERSPLNSFRNESSPTHLVSALRTGRYLSLAKLKKDVDSFLKHVSRPAGSRTRRHVPPACVTTQGRSRFDLPRIIFPPPIVARRRSGGSPDRRCYKET